MTQIDTLIEKLVAFRDARDWKQFHNAKDIALAISIEAGELNELFLWKSADEVISEKIKLELADILSYCLLLAHEKGIDIEQAILDKIALNEERYAVDKAKGSAKKYTEL
jgi:NTP pyrophosphatase (non-canonical NTP hydrolase)